MKLWQLRESLSSSDFTNLLGATMNKRLEKAYAFVSPVWQEYCDVVEVSDFKNQTIIDVSETTDLEKVLEGAEYTQWAFSESAQTWRVYKYGKRLDVPWEWVQNDDLRSINRMVDAMGRAAARTVHKFAVGLLTATAASTTVTTALASSTLEAAINELETRTDATSGERLGLKADLLIVPTNLQFTADQLINSSLVIDGSGTALQGNKNTLANRLRVVIDPYLTDANDWFVAASPAQKAGIEVGFLTGYRNGPMVLKKKTDSSEEINFDDDVYAYKTRHVFGGARIDSNCFVKVSVT